MFIPMVTWKGKLSSSPLNRHFILAELQVSNKLLFWYKEMGHLSSSWSPDVQMYGESKHSITHTSACTKLAESRLFSFQYSLVEFRALHSTFRWQAHCPTPEEQPLVSHLPCGPVPCVPLCRLVSMQRIPTSPYGSYTVPSSETDFFFFFLNRNKPQMPQNQVRTRLVVA